MDVVHKFDSIYTHTHRHIYKLLLKPLADHLRNSFAAKTFQAAICGQNRASILSEFQSTEAYRCYWWILCGKYLPTRSKKKFCSRNVGKNFQVAADRLNPIIDG